MKNKFWLVAILCSLAFSTMYLALTWLLTLLQVFPTDINVVTVSLVLFSTIGAIVFYIFYLKKRIAPQKFIFLKLFFISLAIVFLLTNLTKNFYNVDDLVDLATFLCTNSSLNISTSVGPCHWKVFLSRFAYNINLWIYPLCMLELFFMHLANGKNSN